MQDKSRGWNVPGLVVGPLSLDLKDRNDIQRQVLEEPDYGPYLIRHGAPLPDEALDTLGTMCLGQHVKRIAQCPEGFKEP